MPGYILHLTAAQMLGRIMDKTAEEDDLFEWPRGRSGKTYQIEIADWNAFLAGCLLPDAVSDKKYSHFRSEKYEDEMIEYPDLEAFLGKYRELLHDSSCLGYYYHLYIDYKFFKEYLPRIIVFEDAEGCNTTKRDETEWVRLKGTGERLHRKWFFSEDYYYGDYTRMNSWLAIRYRIPLDFPTDVENPGIEEVDYGRLPEILEELRGYMDVPAYAIENLQVFDEADLLRFLWKAAVEFAEQAEELLHI